MRRIYYIAKRFAKFLYNKSRRLIYMVIRLFKPLEYPVNKQNQVIIHLGCGEIDAAGYINVDGRFYPHIHHKSDVKSLPFFRDNFADLIYTSHTLEHVHVDQLLETLSEWKRVLKSGGKIRISVPDFDKILRIYKDNDNSIDAIWRPLMGGQEYKLNSHYSVFNKHYLEDLLMKAGFIEVVEWNPDSVKYHDFEDWSSMNVEFCGKKYPISLNLEARKP